MVQVTTWTVQLESTTEVLSIWDWNVCEVQSLYQLLQLGIHKRDVLDCYLALYELKKVSFREGGV